ncbi:FAD-dependent oxidoreductase [Leucobacter weissii]|uniref:FAD-dependent oxidoreductase n=2 Tax=Leucobacter weissii TaxID=1983706 RepID=A0A939S7G8_9MICO|nr:FAD-dependent oxidoreductase [Leucobacter weissii]
MPATTSCTAPVRGGEQVRREQGLPAASFDLLRAADLMRPMLRAGFQFRLFARQPRLSKIAGRLLAVLAGGGRRPSAEAAQRAVVARVETAQPRLLVIGGGVSGLTAALAAADAGTEVTLVDQEMIGGRGRVRTEAVVDERGAERSPGELVDELLRAARAHARIHLLQGLALGWIDGLVPVVDERSRTRFELRPDALVLATGGYEVPLMVPGHDLPGVMLADGALRLADIELVRPGRRAVVVADARGEAVAERLRRRGVTVAAIVPSAQLRRVTGWSRATGVRTTGSPSRIRADLVCVAGPRRPAEELLLHLAYAESGSHELVRSDRPDPGARVAVVGSATGEVSYSLADVRFAALAVAEPSGVGHDGRRAASREEKTSTTSE